MNLNEEEKSYIAERYKHLAPEFIELICGEGNQNCADCLFPNISALCLKNKVLLCEKCAYNHSLIKCDVRALNDKKLDPNLIKDLKEISNATVNAKMEKYKPSWFIQPFMTDSMLIREVYIREKYELESWKKNEGETEESTFDRMAKALEDIEKKKSQEEKIRTNWYYLEPGETTTQIVGPKTRHDMNKLLNNEEIEESYYVWHPTLPEWQQVVDVEELSINNRSFKIVKDQKTAMSEATVEHIKFLPRNMRGYLDCKTLMISLNSWKKYWVVFSQDSINLYKQPSGEKDSKSELFIKMNGEDWHVELREVYKDKTRVPCLSLEIHFEKSLIVFTSEDPKDSREILEWYHNLPNKIPMFEDRLNPYRPNVIGIEHLLNLYLRCGTLYREPTTIWESGMQPKWYELTNEGLAVFETAKEQVCKNKYILTKESKVHLGQENPKYTSYRLYHFQIDFKPDSVLHIWDSTDESRQDWIQLIQKVINSKKKKKGASMS